MTDFERLLGETEYKPHVEPVEHDPTLFDFGGPPIDDEPPEFVYEIVLVDEPEPPVVRVRVEAAQPPLMTGLGVLVTILTGLIAFTAASVALG